MSEVSELKEELATYYSCNDNDCLNYGDKACDKCKKNVIDNLNEFESLVKAEMIEEVELSLREAGYEYDENMGVGDNVGSAMLGAYAKGYNKGYEEKCLKVRAEAIAECFKKIEQRLNDDTEISFDLPVEEVLGEDIDMDDFMMLAEEILQEYKRLIFSKLREANYQLKE